MTGPVGAATPRVRVIVVNYNGGDHVVRCVEHLTATTWPASALEIVVVDNASTDGSSDAVEARFPGVRVVRSPVNLGFAGGNNLAMRDLDDVDVVALVNPDAFVTPGWIAPLVSALSPADVGAAGAKLVFDPVFVSVDLDAEATVAPRDDRVLGVKVLGVECAGADVWESSEFAEGFHGLETGEGGVRWRWSEPRASVWVGLPPAVEPPTRVRLRLAADTQKGVKLSWEGEGGRRDAAVSVGFEPQWHEIDVAGPTFEVVNNAGSVLYDGGYGADRGFREVDRGQYESPEDVFAFCGAAVAFRREFLADAGLFDEDFFLYYEDFDLAWRGRLLGWRYRYAPASVVRHVHSASTVEWSPLFEHYVHRNRLLALVKNAPWGLATRAVRDELGEIAAVVHREVLSPLVRLRRPHPDYTRRRLRSFVAFTKHLPRALRARRALGRRSRTRRKALLTWSLPRR